MVVRGPSRPSRVSMLSTVSPGHLNTRLANQVTVWSSGEEDGPMGAQAWPDSRYIASSDTGDAN